MQTSLPPSLVRVDLPEREPYDTLCKIGGSARRTSREIPFHKGQFLEGRDLEEIKSDWSAVKA